MANSEDYLDSLLKAAASEDNPDSAINKVRRLTPEKAPEPVVEEVHIEEIPAEEAPSEEASTDADLDNLISELESEEESESEEEPESEEQPESEEEPESEEQPESTEPETVTPSDTEANDNVDIDALLKSDFAGEVDVSDISSLLDDAAAFANGNEEEKSEEEKPEEEKPEENISLDTEAEEAPVEDLLIDQDPDAVEPVSDSDLSFSEDEINNMLNAASDVSEPEKGEGEMEVDLSDIDSLAGDLGIFDKNSSDDISGGESSGGELDEISSLLNSFDSNEVSDTSDDVDMLDLLNEAVSKQEALENEEANKKAMAAAASAEEAAKAEGEAKAGKKASFLSKIFKKKKETLEGEVDAQLEPENKSLFRKIIDFLTAEDEEESEGDNLLNPVDAPQEGAEGFEGVPGENQEILNEMDKEGEEEGGKKKKKGKKDKKGKKGKDEPKEDDGEEAEDGEEEGGEASDKKGKKKKVKKEKTEKKPLILDIDTGKPLSKRNVKLVFILAASILVAILLIVKLVPGIISNASARKAYYSGDYETVYDTFYGDTKLSDSDQIIFNRSAIILKMSHKYDSYRAYMNMNMKMEALDQLLQGVANYEKWLVLAESCGATEEFNAEYTKVINALALTFNLTEDEAKEVNALETDTEYSLKVYSIVNGTEYINPNEPLPSGFTPLNENGTNSDAQSTYEDVLAEEGN